MLPFLRHWRAYLVFLFILLLFSAITVCLFFLQIRNYKLYQAQALGQQVSAQNVVGERGQIFLQNSQKTKGKQFSSEVKSLAINKDEWTVSVNPDAIEDAEQFSRLVSPHVGIPPHEIISLLSSGTASVTLSRSLTTEQLKAIQAGVSKGIWWQNNPMRVYPQEDMASQVVGFLGGEGFGQYGLEGYYEDMLAGKTSLHRTAKGLESLFDEGEIAPLDGADLYLTLDYNIQFQAESLLRKAKERYDILSGQIIVLRPESGKILALANYPTFDLNQYSKQRDLGIFQNAATQKLFEPGSIMKPFTMAYAINEGRLSPESTYVDTGEVTLSSKTIRNFDEKKYGRQTMTEVLENSINTGAVYASQQISRQTFLGYLNSFGFNKKTEIDLQAEAYSRNEALKLNAPEINFGAASFGQGVSLTPLQIARAFCALVNGGKLMKPYIVEKIVNGSEETYIEPKVVATVISEDTSTKVKHMLQSVVENAYDGFAKIPGYYFGGKTGTAQIPLQNGRGYESDDKTIQSFVGFGPVADPQFLILVKLDQPKVSSSSLSAVPIFKELAQYIINYWQIPPDYEISE